MSEQDEMTREIGGAAVAIRGVLRQTAKGALRFQSD